MRPNWGVVCIFACLLVSYSSSAPTVQAPKDEKSSPSPVPNKEIPAKRSDEDIMFGNQQNKAAGMVDDLLTFSDDKVEEKNSSDKGTQKLDNTLDYYDYLDENRQLQLTDTDRDEGNLDQNPFDSEFYDFDDSNDIEPYELDRSNFRRKRTARNLKKRSFHSTLDDLLGRSKRLRKRALRLKRNANVNSIMALLGAMASRQENQADDASISVADDRQIPDDGYPNSGYEFQDFSNFQGVDPQILAVVAAANEAARNYREFRPNRENSVRVSRRSFYPLDYRYALGPGQKKRSQWGNIESDAGKWGKIADSKVKFDDTEDLERLYELASLLADSENYQYRKKRSTA